MSVVGSTVLRIGGGVCSACGPVGVDGTTSGGVNFINCVGWLKVRFETFKGVIGIISWWFGW